MPQIDLDDGPHKPTVVDGALRSHFPQRLETPRGKPWQEIHDWCAELLGAPAFAQAENTPFYAFNPDGLWMAWGSDFYFRDERAAVMFRLRFG